MTTKPQFNIPFGPMPVGFICHSKRNTDLINRIIARCDLQQGPLDTPCWVWLGADSGKGDAAGRGYGRIKVDGVSSAVHRVMFACFHGYIPPGRDVDHLCENRRCCNPDHLESVTHKTNCKRRNKCST